MTSSQECCSPQLWYSCRTHGTDGTIVYSKGAAEIMLPLCDRVAREDGSVDTLSKEEGQEILQGVQKGGER